jgi:hypothetical protein
VLVLNGRGTPARGGDRGVLGAPWRRDEGSVCRALVVREYVLVARAAWVNASTKFSSIISIAHGA